MQFLTFTGPILAEPAKAVMLRRYGLTVSEGLATTLAEYLASSLAAAVMATIGLGYVLWRIELQGPARIAALVIFFSMLGFALLFAIGFERVAVEFYKTFITRQVRGIHAGKPLTHPEWLTRRWIFMLGFRSAVVLCLTWLVLS